MTKEKNFVITESDFVRLIAERDQLYKMLGSLIVMFKQEDKLKKHHRPYLHVRAEMDKMCDGYLHFLSALQERVNGDNYPVTVLEDGGDCPCCCGCAEQTDISENAASTNTIICDLIDDLIVLRDFMEVQEGFMKLLGAGIEVDEQVAKFEGAMHREMDEMIDRWEQMIYGHYRHESE